LNGGFLVDLVFFEAQRALDEDVGDDPDEGEEQHAEDEPAQGEAGDAVAMKAGRNS